MWKRRIARFCIIRVYIVSRIINSRVNAIGMGYGIFGAYKQCDCLRFHFGVSKRIGICLIGCCEQKKQKDLGQSEMYIMMWGTWNNSNYYSGSYQQSVGFSHLLLSVLFSPFLLLWTLQEHSLWDHSLWETVGKCLRGLEPATPSREKQADCFSHLLLSVLLSCQWN